MSARALLYGATGFTGREVAQRLAEAGTPVVLAGRHVDRVRAVAEPLGLPWTAFDLACADDVAAAVSGFEVVLHAAGPFERTAEPMLNACLRVGAHYLDLSGEWPVFLEAMHRDAAARAASVMVMPGVGLTIVATDCLLALAKRAAPDTVKFRLGVSRAQVITRGTAVSAASLASPEVIVRRNGDLATAPAGTLLHAFDFGEGLREATAMSWADVVTGQFTTGVGDIEVYSELDWPLRVSYRASGMAMALTGARPWRLLGSALAAAWPERPAEDTRRQASFVMVVEGVDPWRRATRLRMRTLDGYTVSVMTAAAAVQRVLAGQWSPGFQTPARMFGPDFILELGCAELESPSRFSGGAAA